MSATAPPPSTGSIDPAHLTIHYTDNPNGWVTAQIVEYPAAISQGATRHEAWVNVLDALHDLTHTPTPAERMSALAQARVLDRLAALAQPGEGLVGGWARKLLEVLRQHSRTRV